MITNEQRKAFEQWYMAQFGDKDMQTTESGNYFYVRHAAAWQAWQAAQQVKPLEIVTSSSGKHAHTQFGTYWFRAYGDEVRMSLPEESKYYGRGYKTEAEAIAAANEDYQRRVLHCLVHGGV